MSPLAIRHQASGIRRRRCQLWQYEELAELETSYNSPATELGDVVFVPVADALDETMHACREIWLEEGRGSRRWMSMCRKPVMTCSPRTKASNRLIAVIVAEEIEALVGAVRLALGFASFPADERFGLTAHLRKTATSVPSNIAEGCGSSGDKELARFLSSAAGSTSELDYQLLLARDLGLLPPDAHARLAEDVGEVRRMLYRFIQSLNAESG